MDNSVRDTFLEINLDNFRNNIKSIKSFIGSKVGIMAMVKANAYGHGLIECAKAASDCGVEMLGVGFTSQAIMIREAGIKTPILVMVSESYEHIPYLVDNYVTISLNSAETLSMIEKYAAESGRTCHVHVKVDTGMGRNGLDTESAYNITLRAFENDKISVDGIYSHFPCADEDDDRISRFQIKLFSLLLERLAKKNARPKTAHICNSAGTLKYPEAHFEMVRPGLLTYGILPCSDNNCLSLDPVMTWKSRITVLRDVPPGYPVSYGCTYQTSRKSKLATIPVGYGDGYRRCLSNKGFALINGKKAPILGRVCMDQTVFDVTDAGPVKVGDPVILMGVQDNETITASEMAEFAETISYEILTGITSRVPRIYSGFSR